MNLIATNSFIIGIIYLNFFETIAEIDVESVKIAKIAEIFRTFMTFAIAVKQIIVTIILRHIAESLFAIQFIIKSPLDTVIFDYSPADHNQSH